ncbi:ANTAR domain-containing protein [Streptomyces sp. NPDC088910]|uniref:ANTAR domain-containing protein n=1 Tax=Streptomyces sp. NPDC088910 TaxID=3365911 RepID=UPI003829E785
MAAERLAEALRLLQDGQGSPAVAVAGAAALEVDGVAVSLGNEPGRTEVLWCSDDVSRGFEDLQLTLGQGPGPDCMVGGTTVRVPDLARVRHDRWPELVMEAPGLAARAVFCFPLRMGGIGLGVLTAVRRAPGPLTSGQSADAAILAAALTRYFLEGAGRARQEADPVNPRGPMNPPASLPFLHHAAVHQATGMVSVQLAVSLADALLRLRAHAYGSGRTVTDVSHDVVATIAILQRRTLAHAEAERDQLQYALNSRIIVEQAKGILAERWNMSLDLAFATLRSFARARQHKISHLARLITEGGFDTDVIAHGVKETNRAEPGGPVAGRETS